MDLKLRLREMSNKMQKERFSILILVALVFFPASRVQSEELQTAHQPQRLVLAHYMPWFATRPVSQVWGWHWTMNAFDPEMMNEGKRQIAAHYYPLVGPYDSNDADVLEYHLLLMKLSGIDGVIVDWYGLTDLHDYKSLHRNTKHLVEQVTRLGMKFAICYEDQTIPALEKSGRLTAENRVTHAKRELAWMAENWFQLKSYVRLEGRPVLLSFGQTGLTNKEWTQCLAGLKLPVAYFSQHHRRTSAMGAFDWPVPQEGLKAIQRFQKTSRDWQYSIPVAFPRFVDIYAEAKVHKSFGRIDDNRGVTFQTSMEQALKTKAPIVQIATWNDWGEGTVIEPSRRFGYRDLKVIQKLRRNYIDPHFSASVDDLDLPLQLLELRRKSKSPEQKQRLDMIRTLISTGKLKEAQIELKRFALPKTR
jgi:hypothetical protein